VGPNIEQDAYIWLEKSTESREKPAMTVDLLRVLFLQTEDHLHRRRQLEPDVRIKRHGGGIYEPVLSNDSVTSAIHAHIQKGGL